MWQLVFLMFGVEVGSPIFDPVKLVLTLLREWSGSRDSLKSALNSAEDSADRPPVKLPGTCVFSSQLELNEKMGSTASYHQQAASFRQICSWSCMADAIAGHV